MNVKIIISVNKYYNWNSNTCICENSQYLKSIADTTVKECNKIAIVMDTLTKERQILEQRKRKILRQQMSGVLFQ